MSDHTDSNFPTVSEGTIGGALVQTVDGRELHAFVKNGEHFSTWIKNRIRVYGFIEGTDFVTYSGISEDGGAPRTDYATTLDMAKELAMVERNEQGRKVRRYFIECEKRLRSGLLAPDVMEMFRRTDGISRMLSGKVTGIEKALSPIMATLALIAARVTPNAGLIARRGRTAGEIWTENGFPKIKVTSWFSNRLVQMCCQIDGCGCGELGGRTAKLFDPDKARTWLDNGGRALVLEYIARRQGQRVLHLVPKPAPAGHGEGATL